jgi:1-acyl-sn-glycerol-3-phosphate acyltransferase
LKPPSHLARFLYAINRVYSRGYHRLRVQTPPQLPETGAAILVSNHISGLDPLLLQSAIRRRVIWMMAAEYYDLPVIGTVFRAVQVIPVKRGARDTSATRAALRTLDQGEVLGIFPEGKIADSRDLLPFETGVAMMALRAGVPVCPAYMDGTNRGMEMLRAFSTPNEVRLRFGPPVALETPEPKPDLERATDKIRDSVANLRREMACDHRI